ncbi:MAG: leucine-rich repeat domain-containing protein [Lachnospiraceae bacterium]|nr:leucine-rich repeat domain-containing protein [Lachnospiraceae bacterium]
MKRINTLILTFCAAALLLCGTAAADYGGDAGGVSWTIDAAGELTVSGSGAMEDYSDPENAPWNDYREEIRSVTVENGVTSVGEAAFYGCTSLTRVTLADSVKDIGSYAFAECSALMSVEMPGVERIGRDAFRYCTSLTAISLPSSLTRLETEAFYRCEGLLSVDVPSSVTYMGSSVFAYCTSLVQAHVAARLEVLPAWTFYGCTLLAGAALGESIASAAENAFYGCENLSVLTCADSARTALLEAARESSTIMEDDISAYSGALTSSTGEIVTSAEDGSVKIASVSVTTLDGCVVADKINCFIDLTDGTGATFDGRTLSVTVLDAAGIDAAAEYLSVLTDTETSESLTGVISASEVPPESIVLNLFCGNTALSGEILREAAAAGAALSVCTDRGTVWEIAADELASSELYEEYDFGAYVSAAENLSSKQQKILGDAEALALCIPSDINFRCTLSLPLGGAWSKAAASLLSASDGELLQSAAADKNGRAAFYLAEIGASDKYAIGMNVEGVAASDVLISSSAAADDYGGELVNTNVEYVVTGITTPFGLSGLQVGLLLLAVLVVCAAAVGAVLFMMNKRKLRLGYVPNIDEEDMKIREGRD